MKIKSIKMIECSDWDDLVKETYRRPYCFQQQEGCRERGTYDFTVPDDFDDFDDLAPDDSEDSLDDDHNGHVSLKRWLSRDPSQELKGQEYDWQLDMWWERNFYPCVEEIANDLLSKGIIKAGKYLIKVDW